MSIEEPMDTLNEARLTFRGLLEKYGLTELAGGPEDAFAWLESQAIELADSVARRDRFRELLRQAREVLTRGRDAQHRGGDSPGGERIMKSNFYSGRRFRRIKI